MARLMVESRRQIFNPTVTMMMLDVFCICSGAIIFFVIGIAPWAYERHLRGTYARASNIKLAFIKVSVSIFQRVDIFHGGGHGKLMD